MSDLIDVHLSHIRAGGYSERTIAARRAVLRRAHHDLPYGLDNAHRDELAAWFGNPRWSTWTRSTFWSHLAGYYEWAYRLDYLTLDPMAGLRRPPAGQSVPDPVTDDELRRALERSPVQPWRLAVILAAYAGLRVAEIAALRRCDVTRDHVRVIGGKGGRDALVDAHAMVWAAVDELPDGLILRTVRGLPWTAKRLTSSQHQHWQSIGLPGVRLHRFRHWCATALLRGGADLRTVQELMRHRSLVSTQGYTLVVSEQRRQAIAGLPNVWTRAEV